MAMSKDDIQGKKVYPVTKDSMSNRIALLINNIDFNDKTLTRHGAEQDQQAMLNLLHHLQYEVVIHQDLTAEEIDQALIKFSKHSKLIKTDSVFVVVMSHGGLGTTSGSDQVDFEIDKIYERLNTKNCPALIDKPKVIIIQACRGENEGVVKLAVSRQSLATENIDSPSKNGKAGVVYVEKDFIGFHSSTPYTYSYRHPKRGSHFIHHICDVFQAACCQDHIEELLKKVKQHFEESPSEHKQMPTIERNTLTKYFYLFPDAVQNRHNQPRLQSLPPDKLLFSVRKQFVEKVSDSTLNLLLDSLVQRRIINMEEMELAKIKHRPDRARNVIDIVRNKGERASSSMIADLHQMDPYLSEILGLN